MNQPVVFHELFSSQVSALYVGSFLPVGIIVLKVSKIHGECQDSGVMVEPEIIIGTFNPLDLLR